VALLQDRKHPQDQLLLAVRVEFLEAVRRECPEAVADLHDRVFIPVRAAVQPADLRTLLLRRIPHAEDLPRGSHYRRTRAAIARWARRWGLSAPWIRDQAWRTLRYWETHPRLAATRRWAPVINTRSPSTHAADEKVLRPRDVSGLQWLVKARVCRPPVSFAAVAEETGVHVDAHAVRVHVNRLAKTLDLPVPVRGRPRTQR